VTVVACSLAAWALFNVLFAGCFLYPVLMSERVGARSQERRETARMRRTI